MSKISKILPFLLVTLILLVVFRVWFLPGEISGGDAPFFFNEALRDESFFPHVWRNSGLGYFDSLAYSHIYLSLPLKILSLMGLSWELIERIAWYWPFLILGFLSSWFFAVTILGRTSFVLLAPAVFLLNTYILMIMGGGQISIGLAYCLFPLVIGLFWRLTQNNCARNVILASLALALHVSFEPRIAYIAVGTVLLYLLFRYKLDLKKYLSRFFEPLFVVFCLHFYWILPFLMLPKQSFSGHLVSTGWLNFLNFANFSNSFSLLHPNWPENIFGKTYFMKPEFLILPILAFSSLLFINSSITNYGLRVKRNDNSQFATSNRIILFFAFLGLIGAFLAKGANPPFGQTYVWLFENIPGMELFRDSTKFYVLVSLSYSVLIPFTVGKIYLWLKEKARTKYLKGVILFAFCCFWFVLIKPAFLGQVGGTLKTKPVPIEYIRLKDFTNGQTGFFRTFWVPNKQRFGFVSANHPAINSGDYFNNKDLSYFLNPKTRDILAMMAVKYVIVPFDSEGEIFLRDRKYDAGQRKKIESLLDSVSWLNKINIFEKIALYEVASYQDHFSMYPNGSINSWKMISPTKYRANITVENPPSSLVFSESFDNLWLAEIDGNSIPSEKFLGFLNSFRVNKKGNFEVEIEYKPQKYIWIGLLVTGVSLISCLAILCASYLKRKTNAVISKIPENTTF